MPEFRSQAPLGTPALAFKDGFCVYAKITKISLTCDVQQCGILTSVDSYEPVQSPIKLRCSASSLKVIEYSSDKQML